jgi:hypothetical protein
MPVTFRPARTAFIFLSAIALLAAGPAVAVLAQGQDASIDGKVSSLSATTLTLTQADGTVRAVSFQPDTFVLSRQSARPESIKPNDALGVAARRESDGSLIANSINIFSPELWNRVRKGQFPMQAGGIMTNALVTDSAAGFQGRVLRLKYGELMATIHVPEGIRVTRLVTERLADLKVGMHVVVRGTMSAEGSLTAASITF